MHFRSPPDCELRIGTERRVHGGAIWLRIAKNVLSQRRYNQENDVSIDRGDIFQYCSANAVLSCCFKRSNMGTIVKARNIGPVH
mmetsp:Transcript_2872/g.6596  ORF Transcript_2872/g.6596 Transcript_2872/m.6596 type:complete len:84 (-) Transcript_2872:625-876(-)